MTFQTVGSVFHNIVLSSKFLNVSNGFSNIILFHKILQVRLRFFRVSYIYTFRSRKKHKHECRCIYKKSMLKIILIMKHEHAKHANTLLKLFFMNEHAKHASE